MTPDAKNRDREMAEKIAKKVAQDMWDALTYRNVTTLEVEFQLRKYLEYYLSQARAEGEAAGEKLGYAKGLLRAIALKATEEGE